VQIQINSDKNVSVDWRVESFVTDEVNSAFMRFADRLTRVEVYLSDLNGPKFGINDKRCRVVVRPEGRRPLTTSNTTSTIKAAVKGALTKMQSSLDTHFGRMGQPRGEEVTAARKAAQSSAASERVVESAKHQTAKTLSAAANEAPAGTFSERGPKKKTIYRARRQAWPSR
jgi:hypothetical protein